MPIVYFCHLCIGRCVVCVSVSSLLEDSEEKLLIGRIFGLIKSLLALSITETEMALLSAFILICSGECLWNIFYCCMTHLLLYDSPLLACFRWRMVVNLALLCCCVSEVNLMRLGGVANKEFD